MLYRNYIAHAASAFILLCGLIQSNGSACAEDILYRPRVEVGGRLGTERSIGVTEAWVPLSQGPDRVLYGDIRVMGDDAENHEWNLGIGYRQLIENGQVALGAHGWVDRRETDRGSTFHQVTVGVEFMSKNVDALFNAYLPANQSYSYTTPNTGSAAPYLAGNGILYDTNGTLKEFPLKGFDVEFSVPLPMFERQLESVRLAGGGFAFHGDDDTETLRGGRIRLNTDITRDLQVGMRFEKDNLRGSQGFLEATLRFPFGNKASSKVHGLRGRLDESPVRDIDVISAARVTDTGIGKPVLSNVDGQAQRVFHVDNTAAPGGDGSLESPFNTLAAANAAANGVGDVIYVNSGDGTTVGMNQGVTLAQRGQALIGSGRAFVYDAERFTSPTGNSFDGATLKAASTAPIITNINANSNGITATAQNVSISGVDVRNSTLYNIYVVANGINMGNVKIENVTSTNSVSNGVYVHAINSGVIENVTLSNIQSSGAATASGLATTAQTNGVINNIKVENIDSTGNFHYGMHIYAGNGGTAGTLGQVEVSNFLTSNNQHSGLQLRSYNPGSVIHNATFNHITSNNNNVAATGRGIFVLVGPQAVINNAAFSDVSLSGNLDSGMLIQSNSAGAVINNISLQNVTASGNANHGILTHAYSGGQIGTATLDNITASNNAQQGVYFYALDTSSLLASAKRMTATGNASHGVYINDDTTGSFAVDLGGGTLGSTGDNRIFGNTATDIRVDLDNAELKAENNWWGNAAGLLPARRTLEGTSTIDAAPFLSTDPTP